MNAEVEAGAERTKRMRYQRGFQGPRLLFYTDALEDFYSQHTDALARSQPREGPRVGENRKLRVTFEVKREKCLVFFVGAGMNF